MAARKNPWNKVRRDRFRWNNGEKLQISSVSDAISRSRPPITPTAASSGMLKNSPLTMAGIAIKAPEISPVK